MKDAYQRQKERESLPYHNRNLNLGPLSVASFPLEVEAADYTSGCNPEGNPPKADDSEGIGAGGSLFERCDLPME